jgi:hypothetical protein
LSNHLNGDAEIHSGNDHEITDKNDLIAALVRGWNTFNVTSISIQVLLPEGLALNLQINGTASVDTMSLTFTGNMLKGSERVRTLAHTPDGSYLDFIVQWRDFGVRLMKDHIHEKGILSP